LEFRKKNNKKLRNLTVTAESLLKMGKERNWTFSFTLLTM